MPAASQDQYLTTKLNYFHEDLPKECMGDDFISYIEK
jgi:hypothetical protein